MTKKYRLIIVVCMVLSSLSNEPFAQTNTFPSSGSVGIGTMNPSSLLDVNGTIVLNVKSMYGGDYDTDVNNYSNVLAIGGVGAESGLKIYKQDSGNSPSFTGQVNYNDAYVFEMTDVNGNDSDGGIVFAGMGQDNVFEGIMYIMGNGRVGIGTNIPDHKLTVAGTISSQEIIVEEDAGADFVFAEDYELPNLDELKTYVTTNKHLPGIARAEEMKENGVRVGELQIQLLQKIEELTLYVITQQEEITKLKLTIQEMNNEN